VSTNSISQSNRGELLSFAVADRAADAHAIAPLLDSLADQDTAAWQLIVATIAGNPDDWSDSRHVQLIELPVDTSHSQILAAGVNAATGDVISVVGARDRLQPTAVTRILDAFRGSDKLDLVYTDEYESPGATATLKPVFSPERLRSQYYLGGLVAYRRTAVVAIDGPSLVLPGAELYDLALRIGESGREICRIAEPLITLGAAGSADAAGQEAVAALSIRTALQGHLTRTGGGEVRGVNATGVNDTRRLVQGSPLVSIVIPTRGDSATIREAERFLVVEAVRSVIEKSTYYDYEFVIVIDEIAPAEVRQQVAEIAQGRVRFVDWSAPFSFSGKVNLGAVHARGEYILLLNDDIEVISEGWIEALLALAQRPRAGLVGAMLYFEDNIIQHAGHAYYRSDVTHIGLGSERGSTGPENAFLVEREVDGVTAACAMLSRNLFFEAGGLSTLLPGNFNDVDLCMKVAGLGYQSYWTPHAELYHFESKSRDPRVALYEITTAWGRWEPGFWESKFWPDDPHVLYRAAASAR
jgi:O-antigen biosynthesis protein